MMERVTALEGQLSRLVEEERTLVEQRLEGRWRSMLQDVYL